MRRLLALIGVVLTGSSLVAAEPVKPPKPLPQDEQDLIFFHPTRAYRLLLHLQIQNRSYQVQWSEILKQLFLYLDQDGNGVISEAELAHAPHPQQLRQLIQGAPELEAMPPPEIKELTDTPERGATLEQFCGYYRRRGVAPWQAEWASKGQDTFLDEELFRLIGQPKSNSLTRTDLKNAEKMLMRLDTDFDELITLPEITPNRGYPGFSTVASLPPADTPFYLFDPTDKGRKLLAERLLKHYDSDKDGKLSPKEFACPANLFAQLDANHDGFLQLDELARWIDQPADLEVLIRVDGPANEGVFMLADGKGQPRLLAKSTRPSRIGAAVVQLPGVQLEILRVEASEQMQALRRMSLQQFKALDANGDGVLDSKEIFQPPFAFVPLLRLADRNGDDKVTEKEFAAFVDLQQKLVTRTMALTLVDRGKSFYDLVDADRDRRLSQRELRTLTERLTPWLDPKTQLLSRDDVPHQYQIIVSHGVLRSPDGDPGSGSLIRPTARLRGPLWFRKMDRNADGDVSRAEFLGTAEQFRKLDLDGDGLIDVHEAEAAGKGKK